MSPRFYFAGALSLSLLFAVALPIPLSSGCLSTCTSSAECGDGEYCYINDGACTSGKASGFCKPVLEKCDAPAPVCGCDGKSYPTACEASKQGASVANTGDCGCGGPSGAKCASGYYCDLAMGTCGQSSPIGTCKPVPAECNGDSGPVCGCDGKTYLTGCLAAQAEVSIASSGECACGGPENTPCKEAGRYCQLPTGACLTASAVGQCAPLETDCPAIKSPVCGCDRKTYDSDCEAAKTGMNVAATVACDQLDGG